jgi:hypothetical protein
MLHLCTQFWEFKEFTSTEMQHLCTRKTTSVHTVFGPNSPAPAVPRTVINGPRTVMGYNSSWCPIKGGLQPGIWNELGF